MHDNGITHRDLKLENILLSGRSNRSLIKITDFGLSKLVDGNTVLRTFCGTRPYMAPEVLLTAGIGTYTSAVDIWSLGVILYACLVGYPPFTEERKDYDLQEQILGGRYDFPDEYWSGISASAKDLVRRLLCVNPTERISLNAALAHPWLSDATIRSQLSDLVETAGYPTLAARVLNHHDHFSPVRNNSDSATVSLDGGSREEDTTKVESKAVTLNLQRRSVNEVLTDGSPAKRTKCVLMEH
ncbi:unnamed protein product [Mesocestoides corti]|uniref:Protein kinase domain-containing protein n=2 Tax=Mesocestoides corti TaxID=53468 RepID=A0A3P6GXA3_MESCO|nr:unnamed protein product [Mesocestoides corti]